ncbi:hypothetical protein [Thioclava sp. GXIMD4215]|uniref:hypothetical protein n=1 Tax=Thioclava sp. GXIMD4215 TaxID=3131928 RepID=UPI003245DD3C
MWKFLSVGLVVIASGCVSTGGIGSDWIYKADKDPISLKPNSFAMMLLNSDRFSDDPNYLAATCDEDGFEFFINSAGFWGQDTRAFRKNQVFEMRVGTRVFSGRYLPVSSGDAAYLISGKPRFSAVDRKQLFAAFSQPGQLAVRVSDYQGTPSTVTGAISGNSTGLLKVAADCGITD